MKNPLAFLLCLLPIICLGQPGYITTIAGNGTSGFSGDGGLATAAQMKEAVGNIAPDGSGNIYFTDYMNGRIRKVDAAGFISTFAGGGSATSESIQATAANLSLGGIALDVSGNLYLIDGNRVRKINITTGIITTVVGTGSSGYSGDGGPASTARLNNPAGICFDAIGNLYIGDGGNNRVRKVSTSGTISTYAGIGISGSSGDGGPATAARLFNPDGLCFDAVGNLYVADRLSHRVRKIDPAGIISTYAGSPSMGGGGDGGPATAAALNEPSYVCMDSYGSLYIADFHGWRVRKVAPSGIISTYAGGGSLTGDGVPATAVSLTDVWGVGIDRNNNIYLTDRFRYRICKVEGVGGIPTATTDSFSVYAHPACSGPEFTISPIHYSASLNVKTWFGDGKTQNDIISTYSGYIWFKHAYSYPGIYTIKHVLYNGITAIDSITYDYTYRFCRTLPVKMYYDANANCAFESSSESFSLQPSEIEVDSAGVTIDTISATSGVSYNAFGPIGTVYKFKPISLSSGLVVSCPISGSISDTLKSIFDNDKVDYFGLSCTSTPGYDMQVFTSFRAGVHHFGGTIIVNNTNCIPSAAMLTMQLSPKYTNSLYFTPAPTSVTGNLVTWNIGSLSSVLSTPFLLRADMEKTTGVLLPFGDTVITRYNIAPVSDDENPKDNMVIRTDSVKSGYDPNEIVVNPSGCLVPGRTNLTYTIHFENMGNDTAFNIYILDTLSNDLDPKSLRIVTASAVMNTFISTSGNYTIARFDFPNINLPDSSHHGLCNGMVVYSINMKNSLENGTIISNRAGIYFDDNSVVLTNTVNNEIGCPTSVKELHNTNSFYIYPNPATDELSVKTDNETYTALSITNTMGQQIMQQPFSNSQTTVDVKMLSPGLYYITLRGEQGSVVKKFLKM